MGRSALRDGEPSSAARLVPHPRLASPHLRAVGQTVIPAAGVQCGPRGEQLLDVYGASLPVASPRPDRSLHQSHPAIAPPNHPHSLLAWPTIPASESAANTPDTDLPPTELTFRLSSSYGILTALEAHDWFLSLMREHEEFEVETDQAGELPMSFWSETVRRVVVG